MGAKNILRRNEVEQLVKKDNGFLPARINTNQILDAMNVSDENKGIVGIREDGSRESYPRGSKIQLKYEYYKVDITWKGGGDVCR